MPRLRFRAKPAPSHLEERFLFLWQLAKGPPLEREFRFHEQRRWRSDLAHLESRTLIEIEGGVWVQGRHNRAAGFNADLGSIQRPACSVGVCFASARTGSRWRTSSDWWRCSAALANANRPEAVPSVAHPAERGSLSAPRPMK